MWYQRNVLLPLLVENYYGNMKEKGKWKGKKINLCNNKRKVKSCQSHQALTLKRSRQRTTRQRAPKPVRVGNAHSSRFARYGR